MLHIDVLNTGAGDVKLLFNSQSTADMGLAASTINDMLRRGYALMTEVNGEYSRIEAFDPAKCVYIVNSAPAAAADTSPSKRGRVKREVPAEGANTVAVAPSAGG